MEGLGSAKAKAFQDPVRQNQALQWDTLRGFTDIKTECKSSLQGSSPQHRLTELTTTVSLTSSFREVRVVSTQIPPLGQVTGIWFILPLFGRNRHIGMGSAKAKEVIQEYNKIQIKINY